LNRLTQPQIIAMGGGALAEADGFALERYVVKQARRRNPAVCYVGAANGDEASVVARFYAAFTELECRPTQLPFFKRTPDLRALILAQDVVYVGGGNTKSMLAVWRDWGFVEILHEAWQSGIVLCGSSAGAICWFETGVTDSWAGALRPLPCLGFLPGACCPHYDSEPERKPSVRRMIADKALPAVLALDDGAAAHFLGTELARIVTSRPKARGYRVGLARSAAQEKLLPFHYVGQSRTSVRTSGTAKRRRRS
jgi:peptidase E